MPRVFIAKAMVLALVFCLMVSESLGNICGKPFATSSGVAFHRLLARLLEKTG
ncbi:MAG: hypothetical protein QXU11_12200 [Thermoproteota archaeon]